MSIEEYDAARTDITRNSKGKIVQLDIYYPYIDDYEIAFGVNVQEFSQAHPLEGRFVVSQIIDEDMMGEYSGTIEQISQETDEIIVAEGINENDIESLPPGLHVNQYIGEMGHLAVAVGATSYCMDKASLHIKKMVLDEMIEQLENGSSPN